MSRLRQSDLINAQRSVSALHELFTAVGVHQGVEDAEAVIARIRQQNREAIDKPHAMMRGGTVRARATYRCTCGSWSFEAQRGTYTASNAARGFRKHLRKMQQAKQLQFVADAPGIVPDGGG